MKPWQIALICVGAFIAALLAFGLMYVYAKWSKIDTKSIKADDIIINEEVKKNKNVDLGDGYTNVALFGLVDVSFPLCIACLLRDELRFTLFFDIFSHLF